MFKRIFLPFITIATAIIVTFLLFGGLETYFSDLLNETKAHPVKFSVISFLTLSSDIILPIPSSIVMYTNGFVLGILPGFLISTLALCFSSVVGYYVGKYTSVGLKAKSSIRTAQLISRYGALSILLTRGIPVLSESICIFYGYKKMPFKQYFIFNLIGYMPVAFLYALCGSLAYDKNTFLLTFGASVLLSVALWVFGKQLLKLKFSTENAYNS